MERRKQTNDGMLRTGEVAWLFSVSGNTVRRWADSGIIRAGRIGIRGDRKFERENVAQLMLKFGA